MAPMAVGEKRTVGMKARPQSNAAGLLAKRSTPPDVFEGASAFPAVVYPPAHRSDVADDYHGTRVADPYRWMEDSKSAELKSWLSSQDRLTRSILDATAGITALRGRLAQLHRVEKYGDLYPAGRAVLEREGRYFFPYSDGVADQPILYTANAIDGLRTPIVDPNQEKGAVSLQTFSVSNNGRWVAYGLSQSGSDQATIHIKDTKTGNELAEKLVDTKWALMSWTPDHQGFYYQRWEKAADPNAPATQGTIYYHRLGTPQSDDKFVYEFPNKDWWPTAEVTPDGSGLVLTGETVGTAYVAYLDLKKPNASVKVLKDKLDGMYQYLGTNGGQLLFRTTAGATTGKVVGIDVATGATVDVVSERKLALKAAAVVGDKLFVSYLDDVKTRLEAFSLDGKFLGNIDLPGIGSAEVVGEQGHSAAFVSYTDFTQANSLYHLHTDTLGLARAQKPDASIDSTQFETKQVFFKSKDGTRVPIFITHKKGIKLDGSNPTLLEGYGGFGISDTPKRSARALAFMEQGGIYALVNLRGGGEYGKAWHEGGMLAKKQNTFNDFIGAAEELIRLGYTSSKKLAINGASNGGLLVGAVMLQRPELFAAAVPQVGVLDMLRFDQFTAGRFWVEEYGSASDAKMFPHLLAYSPLHNVKKGKSYPPTLVVAAENDDRVVPSHSYKFTATLQNAQGGRAQETPALLRINRDAGHGAGMSTQAAIQEDADILAFLSRALGMTLKFGADQTRR